MTLFEQIMQGACNVVVTACIIGAGLWVLLKLGGLLLP